MITQRRRICSVVIYLHVFRNSPSKLSNDDDKVSKSTKTQSLIINTSGNRKHATQLGIPDKV